MENKDDVRRCRICGCTDDDCRQCIEKTGKPCHWVEPDLCSACQFEAWKIEVIKIMRSKPEYYSEIMINEADWSAYKESYDDGDSPEETVANDIDDMIRSS